MSYSAAGRDAQHQAMDRALAAVYAQCLPDVEGDVASYIPELARV